MWSPAWEQEWVSNGIARNRPSPRLIALTSHPHPSPHSHTPCNCRHPRFCQASHSRVFFRRSRLFFREAAFFSGGEGCEWRAQRTTVSREWGYNGENSFSALSPLSPTVARCARHSHPSLPEEKAASRKKSRLRRKKNSPIAENGASCVSIPPSLPHR